MYHFMTSCSDVFRGMVLLSGYLSYATLKDLSDVSISRSKGAKYSVFDNGSYNEKRLRMECNRFQSMTM